MYLLGARLGTQIGQIALWIALKTADLIAIKHHPESRFRNTTLQWNEHGLILLISIVIKHQQNLAELWEQCEDFSFHKFRARHSNARGQQWLWDASSGVHRIQTQMFALAQVAQE